MPGSLGLPVNTPKQTRCARPFWPLCTDSASVSCFAAHGFDHHVRVLIAHVRQQFLRARVNPICTEGPGQFLLVRMPGRDQHL